MPENEKDTKDTWLSVAEVVELTGLSSRSVQQRCLGGKYVSREVESSKGKKRYEVDLASLPEAIKKRYGSNRLKANSAASLKDMKEWQRELAFKRLEILRDWEIYAQKVGKGISVCAREFCDTQREKGNKKISPTTLYRWKSQLKNEGVARLAPRWNNGLKLFDDRRFHPDAKKFVADVYLHGNRPKIREAWLQAKKRAEAEKWRFPHYTTVKRYCNSIPRPVKIKNREGDQKFLDYALPSIHRTYDDEVLKPMQIVVGDHHQVDVAVKFPDGSVGFPWLTMFMDVKTRKPVGWVLCKKPSSDSINVAFQDVVLNYGVMESMLLDNGKDYKCKLFVGENGGSKKGGKWKIEEETVRVSWDAVKMDGIYKDLGIKTIFAIYRNAKAKPVERWFLTFINGFSVHFRGFRGRNIKERPEKLKREWKEEDFVSFDELKKGIAGYINWYSEERVHKGRGMEGRTPNQVFFDLLKTKKAVRPEELALLCSRKGEGTVSKDGLKLFDDFYREEKLLFQYQGRKVRYLYNEDDISKVFVFDLEGRFISIAQKYNSATWNMESDDYAKHNRWKKTVREATKEWEKENLGDRLTSQERENFILSLPVKRKEPKLEDVYYETKYGRLLDEFKELEHRRQENQKLLHQYSKKFAGFEGNSKKEAAMAECEADYYERNSKIAGDSDSSDEIESYYDRKSKL